MLRWSALALGIGYGFQHQRSITSSLKAAEEHKIWERKEDTIQKAKLEWAKKTLPPQSKTSSGDGMSTKLENGTDVMNSILTQLAVISDPMDKNFDLEAYLQKVAADNT